MNKKVSRVLLFIFVIVLILTPLAGCEYILGMSSGIGNDKNNANDNGDDREKQIPIYQGMTITTVDVASSQSYGNGKNEEGKEDFDYEKDNGNHNGHFKGDHTGKDDEVNKDNPFPENNKSENIESEIKSSIEVIGSPIDIYYAERNEDIYINIHISNPDNFEIMSFTLNGKKYSSYMFEAGSDMETIILKYNVGNVSGVIDYTIDAIKYVDGTEIKDVIIDGDKTVKAGIRVDGQVSAKLTNLSISTNAISFNVIVKDNDGLAEASEGGFKTVIYDGLKIVSETDLNVGSNSVSFKGLKTNTVYQYAIVGYYDDLSGRGHGMNVLYTDAIVTDSVVLFDNVSVAKDGISFSFLWHDDHFDKTISKIKLYQDDKLISTLDGSATVIDGLFSNSIYAVIAEYENAGKTESIYLDFITATKAAPEFVLTNTAKDQDSLGFEVIITDTDSVGYIEAVEFIHGSETTALEKVAIHEMENLLSDNEYTLRVTYVYDLNDGEGERVIIKELTANTDAKTAPNLEINNTSKDRDSLDFEVIITDTDSVGYIESVEFIHGSETTALEKVAIHEMENLLSDNEYTLRVTYVYDLNDGEGKHVIIKELIANTDAKTAPNIEINNTAKDQDSLDFEVIITDTDSVGYIESVEVIHGSETTALEKVTIHEIDNLLSDNEYTLRVTYVYDLNDGEGEHVIIKELVVNTDAKLVPVISITNTDKNQTELNFLVSITDVDSVGLFTGAELIHGNDVTELEKAENYAFKDLLSNNDYTLRVVYTYNLNDGQGEKTLLKELTVKTDEKLAPKFEITNATATVNGISAKYTCTDVEGTLVSYKVELYDGNTFVAENAEKKIEFSSLEMFKDYRIVITYTYDVNDGNGVVTETEEKIVKTYVSVIDFKVINTSAVSEGETIYVQVSIENNLGATVSSLVINGVEYNVMPTSTTRKLFIEIVYNNQFEGGDTYLKVDEINATINGEKHTVISKNELSDNVFINGRVEVVSVEYANANFEIIEDGSWVFLSDKVYELVVLNNPTGYIIDRFGYVGYTKLDDNRYYREVSSWYGWSKPLNISTISYHNEYITKTLEISEVTSSNYIYRVKSDEVKYISTPDDLLHMYGGYYYELTGDIDLAGIEWKGGSLKGVFDGKGYSIKNMSFIGDIENSSVYLGLFSSGEGRVQNVSIEEATIMTNVTLTYIPDNEYFYEYYYRTYYGAIVACADGRLNIYGCGVDENTSVNIRSSASNVYVGGLIGYAYDTMIVNCYNSGNLHGDSIGYNAYIGGLVACSYHSNITVVSSYSNGILSSDTASDSYDDIILYRPGYIGGLIAYIDNDHNDPGSPDAYANIKNSSSRYSLIGAISDFVFTTLENSCMLGSLSGHSGFYNYLCTIDQLNSKEFYTEVLGWSEDVWDFTNLDFGNGKGPTLKK